MNMNTQRHLSSRSFDPSPPPGLSQRHFRRIAAQGFGDPYNAYPHSMIEYQGYLYVGTTRANLCMLKVSKIPNRFAFWPVECPERLYDLDMRAQIWRYDPVVDQWREIYRSPWIANAQGETIPRDMGYRGMAVFQGESDPEPALYVSTYASAEGPGAYILRSVDGEQFAPVSKPGLLELPTTTIRTLTVFKDRLFTSPTGRAGGSPNAAGIAVIYQSRDPIRGDWTPVNAPGFGDADNVSVFEMSACGDYLYAGTINFKRGFQVWRTRAEGDPPYRWECIITDGAGRGPLNQVVISFTELNGALYIGSGIQNGGIDNVNKVGPAAPELIRLNPDGDWDLIVGNPRKTSTGIKRSLSGFRPGFNNLFNGYFWRMVVHQGWLYLGTLDWSRMLTYAEQERWPAWFRRTVDHIGLEKIIKRQSGFDLYRSFDGENWLPVTTDGFGNSYNYGLRSLISTSSGLFVGAVNPFGPRVAYREGDQWDYRDNPDGGLEIWLGCH